MASIKINSLVKDYKTFKALDGIDLEVKNGEFFGFIGPNGSGKSTTIKLLLNFIYQTSGEAQIFNLDSKKESQAIKDLIGYVPSEVNYYKNMKVKEILDYSLSFKKNKDREKLDKLCDIFEVNLNKKVSDLSLGNKKKIAIIQALIGEPELLILDEPTNGLDPLMQKKLFEVLVEENKKGTTIFFSSHNLNEVQKFCDRVAIIKDGKIIDVKEINKENDLTASKVIIKTDDNLENILKELNITDYKKEENETTFIYESDINLLIKSLQNIRLYDLKITEPSFEDTFIKYYEKEN